MKISSIDNGALECTTPEGLRLGFPTGISTRRFSSADTVAIRKSDGVIVNGSGEISSWPIERFIDVDGDMVAVGPWLTGSRPFESEPVSMKMISRLLPAIQSLRSAGYPMNGLYSRAVRWLPEGGVLIFPPRLAAWMGELNRDSRIWIHPDLDAEAAWSFSLGVIAWETLTGIDPFAGETEESRRERIRGGILPPMDALIPGIREESENFIRRALTGSGTQRPSLDDWADFIDLWRREGVVSTLSESEIQERKNRAAGKAAGIEKKLKNRRWFRKSGWKLLISAAVTAGVLAFISAPIRKVLETPVTAGMTTVEVAAAYYNAITEMDAETMDDCLARKVGKDDVRLINTIYVTTKMRQGYERISEPPKASDWINNGKPDLPEGIWPWGISDLTLVELEDGRIEAHYIFWTPPEGGTESDAGAWSISRTDTLSFVEGRRSFKISRIERTTEG